MGRERDDPHHGGEYIASHVNHPLFARRRHRCHATCRRSPRTAETTFIALARGNIA